MSLNYDLTRINYYDDVCFDDEDKLNVVTQSLIFITMNIGMNEITEKNAKEFFTRCAFYEKVFGAFRVDVNGDKLFFSYSEILDHIGLKTNASTMTTAKFRTIIYGNFEREIRWAIRDGVTP